jgi:hypothetical protein
MENQGVKETKELAIGFIALAAVMAESFKDGVQVQDFASIWAKIEGDAVLKAKIVEAYNAVDLVKEEIKEVSVAEMLEVVGAALPEIQKLMLAIKK